MASEPIVLSDPRMLAEFMRQSEFKAFFEKRFAVPPDYAALLFKNGELVDAFKGGHFSVGGLVDRMKSLIGGSTHISMMIADLKPFQLQTVLRATSRDKVEVTGVVTLEVQVNTDKPSNILGMMHGVDRAPGDANDLGRKALAKADVLDRIRPHFSDRVFEAAIGRVDAADIRGDTGLQDKLQADMMKEVERVVGDLGLIIRSTSIEWAQNAEEAAEQARADAERRQKEVEFQIEMAKRQAELINDATEFEIRSRTELAKLQNASEDELKHMALNSEIEFIDARENAKRRQELEELDHQVAFLEKERKATFENQLATARNETELMRIQQEQLKIDTDMSALRETHMQEMKKSGAFSELEVSALAQKQQREHISELQEIELRGERVRAEIKRLDRQQELDGQKEILIHKKGMSAEQILALDAGLSPDVAMVLAERARAEASSNEQSMALMREMVEAAQAREIRTEDQARTMSDIAMRGAVGVAAGAGGKPLPEAAATGQPQAEIQTIDCPKCSTAAPATSKFCMKCGHKLRT
ncbi:hypothetical protein [Henriciella aquimarina]|uniref:hypothetical protein n=1 Tax=Henriciella aquimarina TaxID=545261 RepID=UPI000A061F3C|nr:hypothetical protein [Henriciella aquimarina]